ncbi:MAG: TlpA family protein disulfide reductase [Clostridia bacterium]|nr:TlpA family protein disulfide reductase [Clostridia bacterium]
MKTIIFRGVIALILIGLLAGVAVSCDRSVEESQSSDATSAEILDGTESAEGMESGSSLESETESPYLAPDFTVYDLAGNAVKLSDFRGQPIVLNFWASDCYYCTLEMPDFQAAYEKYRDDVVFLMVCFTSFANRSVEHEQAYIDDNGYTFPIYFDTSDSAVYAYGISAIPQTFFIDRNFDLYTYIPGMASAESLEHCIGLILD